jgi:SAM-dependent methyltransferase
MNKSEIINFFNKHNQLNDEQKLYLEIHAKRFETILGLIGKNPETKTLDIGPSFLSELLYQMFGKNLTLLGFKNEDSFGGHLPNSSIFEKVKLSEQDLNFFKVEKSSNEKFDLIVCAEVIEHLYTSPKTLFQNFHHLLNNKGILIIQTPNAVALKKRMALLFGKNPFEMPRENLENPDHYREYTIQELIDLGKETQFMIKQTILDEYFEYTSKKSKIYKSLKSFIPNKLKSGITIVYQRND